MSAIQFLGNGLGYIYVTNPDGTTVRNSYLNTPENARLIKSLGVQSAATALGRRPLGSITFNSFSGNGSIVTVTINGNDQTISPSGLTYTAASTPSIVAASLRDLINNYYNASANYTAVSIGATIYVIGDTAIGATDNGQTITVSNTGSVSISTTTVDGGSSNDYVYDEAYGYRFFLNANFDSSVCSGCGSTASAGDLTSAQEITDYIVNQGLQNAIQGETATIASGAITLSRTSALMTYLVDTEAAAASDDLDSINPTGFADNDILVFRAVNSGRVVTFKHGTGNFVLAGDSDFATANYGNTITLQYIGGSFYEVSRTPSAVGGASAFRAASFPFVTATNAGKTDLTAADNTSVTLTVNSSKRYQLVTGTATLSTGDYVIAFSTTGAIAGDTFIVEYNANVTISGNNVTIGGRTLTAYEALTGGLLFKGYYDGSAWQTSVYYDLGGGYTLTTANISNSSITVDKVENNLKYEWLYISGSFETGEVGDYKIKMPYSGTVSEIYAYATKAIAGTDDGTITPKDNGGTTMTAGVITFTASDARGTAYTSTPTANNTFVAGDILTFTHAKTTAGGKVNISVKITRS